MATIKILHRDTSAVLFEGEYDSLKDCVKAAVSADANLADANLAGAYLADANLAGANLAGANLAGAYLADANLADANLADADLAGANLAGADLAGANLAGANLAGAYLADAYLAGADLAGAYLAGANLAGAYLADANLAGANLAGADLAGANLADANLADAYLADARNVPSIDQTESTEPYTRTPAPERYQRRAERFRARNPDVPVIEALDRKILEVIESGTGKLAMSQWHTCETTHCRAGWAITLAGEAGKELERRHGSYIAGRMLYTAATGRVPHFFASDACAMEDIRACAAEQAS